MWVDKDHVVWKHEEFDSWLACEAEEGEAELKYWEARGHGSWRDESRRCAAVRLRLVE